MAKATDKKEFAWDTENVIGQYGDSKERHVVKICTLNGKTYVVDEKSVEFKKDGWKVVKNTTIEMGSFDTLVEMVNEWKLTQAFEGTNVAKAAKKAQKTKEEQAATLKAVKSAAQVEEKPKRGRKTGK